MLAALPSGPISAVLGDAQAVRLHRRFQVLLCAGMLEFVPVPAPVLTNAAFHAAAGARFVLLVPRANVALMRARSDAQIHSRIDPLLGVMRHRLFSALTWSGIRPYLAKLATDTICFFFNFLVMRCWVYRHGELALRLVPQERAQ
jgi:hypothetical protein